MSQNSAPQQKAQETFVQGRQQQASGDLSQAKRAYGEVLALIPHHADALTMLGSIAYQEGDDLQAEAYLERAIAIYGAVVAQMPGQLRARGPLVNLLLARGRIEEAQSHADALELPVNPVRATPQEFMRRIRFGRENGLPPILINTVPKSASESIWNRLAEGLYMGQGHISLGLFPDCCVLPARVRFAQQGGFITKEHIAATPYNLAALSQNGLSRVVCHLRDPRQATLSWAHFVRDDVSMRMMAPIWRKIVPPASLPRDDIEAFVDWSIDHYLPHLVDFVRGWIAVEQAPDAAVQVLFMTFEQFRTAPESYFEQILSFYDIDPAAYRSDAEAKVVHLRKGQVDEWREAMSSAQRKRAWKAIPKDMAARFGWEP